MLKEKKFIFDTKNNEIVKEYKNLIRYKYKKHSIFKEKKVNTFLEKCVIKNTKTNELIKIKKDIKKEFNETKNLTFLKSKELNRICEENDLERVFITFTNPSKFHPFITTKNKEFFCKMNKNFDFNNLEERINRSYINIKEIFREFYKNVKQKENKNRKIIKVIERHRSLICHLHCILFIEKGSYEKVEKKYNRILKKHDLKECEIEKLKDIKGSSYITKYLIKSYEETEMRAFDGYKKLHKIRIFTMSNLSLSTTIFKKLYFNNRELNKKIFKNIKENKSKYNNLYHFYTENTSVKNYDEEYNFIKEIKSNSKKKRFVVFKRVKKEITINKNKQILKKHLKDILNYYVKKINKEEIEENEINFINIIKKYDENLTYKKIDENNEKFNYFEERIKILDLKIYDRNIKKEIYNNKNFILIKMVHSNNNINIDNEDENQKTENEKIIETIEFFKEIKENYNYKDLIFLKHNLTYFDFLR